MNKAAIDFHQLSIAERIQLVEDIWDSIAAETQDAVGISESQRAELNRRLKEHDADPSTAIPWDEVRAELFKKQS